MDRAPLIVTPENSPAPLNVVGTAVTVLASNERTQGQEFTFQAGDEGTGPPPHSHAWDEAFFVTRGSVEFTCDGVTDLCPTGSLVFVPGGTIHAFKYGPGGGAMLEITGAGSHSAQMFAAIDAEVPPGPPDVEKIIAVMQANGVTVHR